MPEGGTDSEFDEISPILSVKEGFPPAFVMTAKGDFLRPQSEPFFDKLKELGTDAEYHCYGTEETPLGHVFHINIKLPEANRCNEDECRFFLKHVK